MPDLTFYREVPTKVVRGFGAQPRSDLERRPVTTSETLSSLLYLAMKHE